jgi:hypothetical protein
MTKQLLFRPYISLKAFIVFSVICLLFTNAAIAQLLEYKEIRGDEVFVYHYTFHETAKGFDIRLARMNGNDTTDKQFLITDKDFNTLSWRYIRFGEETDVLATLTPQGEVLIKGVLDGDEVDELEELDDDEPWIQLFPMNPGFDNFIFSDEDEIVFWSIGTESPADMEINSFSAEKEEQGYSDDFGCEVIRVNFSPTGWKSFFWDGDYYFRPSDARVLGYRGDGAPGKPSAKTTLIREE